ncbi:MAG: hypothetical protein U9R79_00190 [Armatimonadota bacterium]|nr:hypothetical protein [Armatimonadota bacterium]
MRREQDQDTVHEDEAPQEEEPKPADFIVHVTEGIDAGERMHRKDQKGDTENRDAG